MVSSATARALVLVTAVKLLLVPAYKSTDFEVHRNWLAITSQLPPRDGTSTPPPVGRWITLPLFAWFARGLAFLAPLADPGMLTLQAEPYDTPATTLFMRCTVIVSDALLALGALWITSPTGDRPSRAPARPGVTPRRALLLLLVVFSPGLLMIDHVHFQYNGAASGALLCALAAISRGAPATGACIFSVLVHFKHVHVYAAPAIAAHLLAHRVGARWSDATRSRRARLVVAGRCARYLAVAVLVTAVSLGPFAREGVLGAVFSRLFPFGRGLSHAYWAPNVWALYNAADKFIAAAARRAAGAEAFPARPREPRRRHVRSRRDGRADARRATHRHARADVRADARVVPSVHRETRRGDERRGDAIVESPASRRANDDVRVRVRMARPREGTSDGDDAVGGGARAGRW